MSAPDPLREGVRLGVRAALEDEVDRTTVGTGIRIALAALLGLAFSTLAIVLLTRGSAEPASLHLAVCAGAWASILAVTFALALLGVGSRRFPIGKAAGFGLVGLLVIGVVAFAVPEPRPLMRALEPAMRMLEPNLDPPSATDSGDAARALCLAVCMALIASTGAFVALAACRRRPPGLHLPAFALFLALWPAAAVLTPPDRVLEPIAWSLGLVVGSWGGVVLGRVLDRTARRIGSSLRSARSLAASGPSGPTGEASRGRRWIDRRRPQRQRQR